MASATSSSPSSWSSGSAKGSAPSHAAFTQPSTIIKNNEENKELLGHSLEQFLVLGIESGDNKLSVALIDASQRIRSEEHLSLFGLSDKSQMAKTYSERIDEVIQKVLSSAGVSVRDLRAIAVSVGPGNKKTLEVGVSKAQSISLSYSIPLVNVNSSEAQLLAPGLTKALRFPFVALLATSTETDFIVCKGLGKYSRVGGTLNIPLGVAFEKAYQLLAKAHPELNSDNRISSMKAFEKFALSATTESPYHIPIPLRNRSVCNLSFVSLLSSLRGALKPDLPKDAVIGLGLSFETAVTTHLKEKTAVFLRKIKSEHPEIDLMVIAGGATNNEKIRRALTSACTLLNYRPFFSDYDNHGSTIAWTAIEKIMHEYKHNKQSIIERYRTIAEDTSSGSSTTTTPRYAQFVSPCLYAPRSSSSFPNDLFFKQEDDS